MILIIAAATSAYGAVVPADTSGVRPGPIQVNASSGALTVQWPDEANRTWTPESRLNDAKPLITSVSLSGSWTSTTSAPDGRRCPPIRPRPGKGCARCGCWMT